MCTAVHISTHQQQVLSPLPSWHDMLPLGAVPPHVSVPVVPLDLLQPPDRPAGRVLPIHWISQARYAVCTLGGPFFSKLSQIFCPDP